MHNETIAASASWRDGDHDVAVGLRLRGARHNAGLTIDRVAWAVGARPDRVAQYEAGQRMVPALVLFRLAALFGTEVERLLSPQRRISVKPAPDSTSGPRSPTSEVRPNVMAIPASASKTMMCTKNTMPDSRTRS